MPKRKSIGTRNAAIGIVGLVVVAIIFLFLTKGSPCDDDLRNTEKSVNIALDYFKKNAETIGSSAGISTSEKFSQLFEMTAANYTAIRLCVTECRFLEECMKFRFFEGAATACPIEYENYRKRATDVLALIAQLEAQKQKSDEILGKAKVVGQIQENLDIAIKSSGATGNEAKILGLQLESAKRALNADIDEWLGKIEG